MPLPVWVITLIPLTVLLAVVYVAWRYARRGTSAVHRAASHGNVERLAELLLTTPRSVHAEDLFGWLPLQYAAFWGQIESARTLLAHGADPNRRGAWSPLHHAASQGHVEMVGLLLDHGAQVDAESPEDGATPLHNAVIGQRVDVVRLLLARGANVEARTKSSWTACHFAAASGNLDVLRALLAHGADWQAINAGGESPLELAQHDGRREVVEFVLEWLRQSQSSLDPPLQDE